MQTIAAYVETPYYVLMDGKRRFGPSVLPLSAAKECLAVYGFSDKDHFDKFRAKSHLALVPYPLTEFYLRSHADEASDGLNLVVVDAAGPDEPHLHAATMEAVLQGQEDHTPHVTAAYDLLFEQGAAAYRVAVNRNLKTEKGRCQPLQ